MAHGDRYPVLAFSLLSIGGKDTSPCLLLVTKKTSTNATDMENMYTMYFEMTHKPR